MEQQQDQTRGRDPSVATHQQPHINRSHSPSPARPAFDLNNGIGLGLGIDTSASQPFSQSTQSEYATFNTNTDSGAFLDPQVLAQDIAFDPSQNFTDQLKADSSQAYNQNYLTPQTPFSDDFTVFPTSSAEQVGASLFVNDTPQLATPDMNNMASQVHHSPTPPHLLQPDSSLPGSAHQSPSFNTHQFSSPPGRHSRNVSLGPESALMPGQVDWSAHHFQGHRRTPSEYSDASSIGHHSPALLSQDGFPDQHEHSPMQRPQDAAIYQELHGIGSFSLSDPIQQPGRSPSHSPALSPNLLPQTLPEMSPGNLAAYGSQPYMQGPEAFPQLPSVIPEVSQQMQMPAALSAPTINIDFVPTVSKPGNDKQTMDTDALTPPERGRNRRRAVTDPYNNVSNFNNRAANGSPSPSVGSDFSSRDSSRSLSPLDRSVPPNRRRQSTSAVPTNVIALRLADPEFAAQGGGDAAGVVGGPKRAQKHPATFQCTLCPKRFTRAYNLRSHLRTHTDERPFVCTVCQKAFARQHDRKRHESLHSGEKKFVCKGDLKTGGQWGCGRRFARADALGRHFRSEAGRICIKPLLDEEMEERQRQWHEHRMQAQAQSMMMAPMDPSAGYPMDATGNYALPQAILAQYPALAQVNWSAPDMGGGGSGIEDDHSGRSSYDASDYDENDDGGYVSGPGTGFGQGGMNEGFGEMGYASDYGGR